MRSPFRSWAERRAAGTTAGRFEKLWVEVLPDDTYRLVRTPKLAFGLAREDTFRVDPRGNVIGVTAGPYWGIQLVSAQPLTAAAIEGLIAAAAEVGGTLDVHDDLVAGLAVPKGVTEEQVTAAVDRYSAAHPVRAWWVASGEDPEVRE
ncbi:DUF4265 domain-containing protein [Actinoplanes sp. NPDC026623]|uniref:DUF4265 domain-containing protein n=1 Tax=Actinoplanes sp. NPDC026623 TaxID=3155610 RepID=UPI0033C51FC2